MSELNSNVSKNLTDPVILRATRLSENLARDSRLVNPGHTYSKASRKKMNSRKQSRRHENSINCFFLLVLEN